MPDYSCSRNTDKEIRQRATYLKRGVSLTCLRLVELRTVLSPTHRTEASSKSEHNYNEIHRLIRLPAGPARHPFLPGSAPGRRLVCGPDGHFCGSGHVGAALRS